MRTPSRYSRYLVALFAVSVSAWALEVGEEWNEPPAELGRPLGRIVMGEKTLYRWTDLEVTVAGGRVVQIRRLDAASVAADNDERAKVNAAERARLLAERKERTRQEAERAERELAEQSARARAAAEAEARAAREAEARAAAQEAAAVREKREQLEAVAREQSEIEKRTRELTAREAKDRAEQQAKALEAVRREEERRAAESAKAEAKTRAEAEAKARAAAEAKARAAQKAAEAAAASASPETKEGGISLVKTPKDPVAKLEREIGFLELDLNRAELGTEARDRAEAARLRLLLKEKRAQLEAARKKS